MQTEKITAIHPDNQFRILSGAIESIDEQGYRIISGEGDFIANRAFSCIVAPEVADTILFSRNGRQCSILAIIERPGSTDTQLIFPGDITVNAAQGQMNLHARQDINISSQQKISQLSEDYSLVSKKALLSVENLTAVGSRLVSNIGHVQTIADTLETVAGNLLQKVRNSFRQVDGVDQTRAQEMIVTVKNLYSQRSRQAAILAKKDIKVDAERIHMG